MKNKFLYLLPVFFLLCYGSTFAQQEVENRDLDGNVYETIQLGDKVWMTENLKTTKCEDGSHIAEDLYKEDWKGRSLYASAAFERCNICPSGWRVPTKQDVKDLAESGLSPEEAKEALKWDWETIGGSSPRLHVQEATLGIYTASDLTEVMKYGYGWTVKGKENEFFAVRCVSEGQLIASDGETQEEMREGVSEGRTANTQPRNKGRVSSVRPGGAINNNASAAGQRVVVNKDLDGNIYETVKLGDKVWMTQNLKSTKCEDGSPIPENLYKEDWKGRSLYSSMAFEQCNICPSGWRVPTKEDVKGLSKSGLSAEEAKATLKWDWETIGGSSPRMHVQEATLGINTASDLTEVMKYGYGWTTKGKANEYFAVRCVSDGNLQSAKKPSPPTNRDRFAKNPRNYQKPNSTSNRPNANNNGQIGSTSNDALANNTGDKGGSTGVDEYYRVDNLSNPTFTKLDKEKAKTFVSRLEDRFKENEKLKRIEIFPRTFNIPNMGHQVYAVKLQYSESFKKLMMATHYLDTEMMNPKDDSYNPTRAGNLLKGASSIPSYGNDLRGGQRDGFIVMKAQGLNPANPPAALKEWIKNNLNGIFDQSTPKLKLSISSNNELSFCLGLGKIHTYKEQNGKLSKVRSLDVAGDLIAFTRGEDNKYCIVTSDGKSDNTYMHAFKGASDRKATQNLKLWDKYKQDNLKDRPYPTLDYANGEYLFQYYIHMWEASMNTNLHSASFRIKIQDDGSVSPRTWQTSHTFGMDALHNGTDWVSLYATDGDYFLNHPGVFIDKFDQKQKALLFSSPQRWAERGQGDAAHGQMNFFYTGLGGIAYNGSGYGAVFNNPKMKTAPSPLPQNVGFVYVSANYESTPRRQNGDKTPIDPTKNILSAGTEDNVTIYTERMNTEPVSYKRKVKWLSNYTSIENGFSNNTDIAAIGDKFVVVWEKWAKVGEEQDSWGDVLPVWDYLGTEAAVVDKSGKILKTKSLGKHPLNNWDDLRVQNGKVVWATFDNATFSVHVNTLDTNLNHNVKKMTLP